MMNERTKEINKLVFQIESGQRVIAICGPTGSGKTTVIQTAFQEIKQKQEREELFFETIFTPLNRSHPPTFKSILKAISLNTLRDSCTGVVKSAFQFSRQVISHSLSKNSKSLTFLLGIDDSDFLSSETIESLVHLPRVFESYALTILQQVRFIIVLSMNQILPIVRLSSSSDLPSIISLNVYSNEELESIVTRKFQLMLNCSGNLELDALDFVKLIHNLYWNSIVNSDPRPLLALVIQNYPLFMNELSESNGNVMKAKSLLSLKLSHPITATPSHFIQSQECKKLIISAYIASHTHPSQDKELCLMNGKSKTSTTTLKAKVTPDSKPFNLRRLVLIRECLFPSSETTTNEAIDAISSENIEVYTTTINQIKELIETSLLSWKNKKKKKNNKSTALAFSAIILECNVPWTAALGIAQNLNPPLYLQETVDFNN